MDNSTQPGKSRMPSLFALAWLASIGILAANPATRHKVPGIILKSIALGFLMLFFVVLILFGAAVLMSPPMQYVVHQIMTGDF